MNWIRSLAVGGGAIAQIAFGAIPFAMRWPDTVASRSNAIDSLITPATYAFSIWSLLFAGLILFAIYHAVRGAHPPMQRIGWFAAIAMWVNAVWEIYVPLEGFTLRSVVIIFGSWFALVVLGERAVADGEASVIDKLIRLPLFALAGWLTAASFVNLQVAAISTGLPWLGEGGVPQAITVLAAATLAASVLVWRWASLSLAAAFGWGLAAIWVANYERGEMLVANLALGAIGVLALVWIAGLLRLRRQAS